MVPARFRDRDDAGLRLVPLVAHLAASTPIVLGIPRGGVIVGKPIADALQAPLDVLVVRKVGLPWHPEFAIGALAEDGTLIRDREVEARVRVTEAQLQAVVRRERIELSRRVQHYRQGRSLDLAGRTAVLVDDGLATGKTAHAAIFACRALGAARVILVAPVASVEAVDLLSPAVDEMITVLVPRDFGAVGEWYSAFGDVSDAAVRAALR